MAQSNPYYTKGTDGKDVLINKLGITTAVSLQPKTGFTLKENLENM